MNMFLSVAIGGALGACARYGVAQIMLRQLGPGYPYGTLLVNIVGSFLMGVLIELIALRWSPSPEMRVLLVTGFLGGFTTFSAFSLDVALMVEKGETLSAVSYVLMSVFLSIAGLFAGLHLMRAVL
ncbi:fluoride efflux transporter CrcB [Sneathiella sp. HT1-7]|uniref:fluoride efflux transporter CrcB n=1 Tax=Sneathiella sp. HT1-7 TaxID=2887192 RepID=UPI001D135D54|nr:fluoride efflux transporter CrcB [Sneathiella sp. HT1-7]MCC3304642.1 fluoride efflux transporter CrcB [Sneathiella sp. HT1-7]